MNIQLLNEPELEFGFDKHIDIRFGIMNYGPFDYQTRSAPKVIQLGFVGTPQTIEGVLSWLEKCSKGIEAKKSNQPQLFPRFPGFGADVTFRASFATPSQLQRPISPREIEKVVKFSNPDRIVAEAVELFDAEVDYIAENHPEVDVIVCSLPFNLLEAMLSGDTEGSDKDNSDDENDLKYRLNFRHMLKAKVMRHKKPIQIVLPMTYDPTKRLKTGTNDKFRKLQDEATRAWNIHTALYYKAHGIPWRLIRDLSQPTTCYVGISFYMSLDQSKLLTSLAQIFNERGDGIIVRGAAAKQTKDDKRPYLDEPDSYKLLLDALQRYRREHFQMPARVVIHKSSPFRETERRGLQKALDECNIDLADFMNITRSGARLFRTASYPPLRGTLLNLDDSNHLLYTRGSVDFYSTYPGMYIPSPLLLQCSDTYESPRNLAEEILGLTKMNWNDTQFDGGQPITLSGARYVGNVLKYLSDSEEAEPRYSYYM